MLLRGRTSAGRALAQQKIGGARWLAAAASSPYDVVVIGGGPGGYVGAIKAGQLGLKVGVPHASQRLFTCSTPG